ncbi:DUF4247 domain-containing protein [Actinoplanes sp. NPDC049118]|uniref:DUF4247 domain-containing protein n=1 Tax=Actinoplanes sp. NPDC049118 TaxID=3155769 RepID=UPI0033F4F1AD
MRKRWRTEDRREPTADAPAAARRTGGPFGVPQAAGYAAFLTALAVFFVWTTGVPGQLSVRGHVDAAYSRSHADDIGRDAVAYTSPLTPTRVAGAITDRWQPGRGAADADGVYLRYADDSVVILRRQHGSIILVEKTTTAYPRYLDHVAGHWDR